MSHRRQQKKELIAIRKEAERKAASRRELYRRIGFGLGLGLLLVVVLVLFQVVGGEDDPLLVGLSDTYREYYEDRSTACDAEGPPAPWKPQVFSAPEPAQVPPGAQVTAIFQTSCGDITAELNSEDYPETVNSFVFLARQGFYDWTVFHRVAEDFLIAGGDPEADGKGGPGYTIDNEFPPEDFVFRPGTLAMFNSGSGSTGSQFFFAIGKDAEVLSRYNLLGRVTSGQEVWDLMVEVPRARRSSTNEHSFPLESIYLEKLTISVEEPSS